MSDTTSLSPLFENIIEQSKKDFIRINPIPLDGEEDISPTASKFLGLPYVPNLGNYPKSDDGTPMMLMAQINFDDVTRQAANLPEYPQTGLLQFFCSADDMWGLDGGVKVIYHKDYFAPTLMNDETKETLYYAESPIEGVHRLAFKVASEPCGGCDEMAFNDVYAPQKLWQDLDKDGKEAFINELYEVNNGGCKLGGYAFFTQQDSRYEEHQNMVLLLQIDSENETTSAICWGDGGVGNWFITREDLKNLNFDNVYFSWDCY